jgi:fatty acid desaturase
LNRDRFAEFKDFFSAFKDLEDKQKIRIVLLATFLIILTLVLLWLIIRILGGWSIVLLLILAGLTLFSILRS